MSFFEMLSACADITFTLLSLGKFPIPLILQLTFKNASCEQLRTVISDVA